MNKKLKKILIRLFIIMFFLINSSIVKAKTLEFSEISIKDKNSDWIEINISSKEKKDIFIKDDSLILKISPEKINKEKFLIIHFKSEKEYFKSEKNILHFYSKKPGLTGTTEQLTIETDEQIIDSVCWQKDSPTESEKTDIQNLLKSKKWNGKCIDSDEIKTNFSIAKIGKKNDANSWKIFSHPSQGKENKIINNPPIAKISIQKGELKNKVPFSINLDGSESFDPDEDEIKFKWEFPNNKIIEKKNPASYKFKTAGNYEIKLTVTDPSGKTDTEILKITAIKNKKSSKEYKNGKLSNKILITEIFPNPAGKDSKKEWIELYNDSNTDINLGNWKIISSSKEYILSDKTIIKAKSYISIGEQKLNLNLKNQTENIELVDFNNKTIDKNSYTKSQENKSYSLITIKSKSKSKKTWLWTKASKRKKNKIFYELSGEIIKELTIDKDFYFEIINKQKQIQKIIFDHKEQKIELIENLLTRGKEVEILGEKIDDNTFVLMKYNIKNTKTNNKEKKNKKKTPSWTYYLIEPIIILFLSLIILEKRAK